MELELVGLYTCIVAYTCILAYMSILAYYVHMCIIAYLNTCILAYMHTCIVAYTCILAYWHTCFSGLGARIFLKIDMLVDTYTDNFSFKFHEDLFIGFREIAEKKSSMHISHF